MTAEEWRRFAAAGGLDQFRPPSRVVIVAVASGPGVISLDGLDAAGMFLKSFDPDAMEGRGLAEWTANRAEALTFPGAREATELFMRQSTVRPLRDDGLPNRPLTAYSVIVEEL